MSSTLTLTAFQLYECNVEPLSAFNMIPFFPEGSGVLLHLCRCIVFSLFALYYEYQRRKVSQYAPQLSNGIMLPILSIYIILFICLNILVTLTSAFGLAQDTDHCATKFVNICIALQTGLFHLLYEGMAIFLCKYGIGIASLRSSLFVGLIWACVSFFFFFILSSIICHAFDLPSLDAYIYEGDATAVASRRNKVLAITFIWYKSLLAIFYAVIWLAPMQWFYRRPAAFFYAKCNLLYQVYWIAAVTSYLFSYRTAELENVLCSTSAISVILLIFIMPYVICRSLMIDSNYWQGLMVGAENPTAQLYLRNDVATATSLAQRIGSLEASYLFQKNKVQVLHFGQLDLDHTKGYISGGFSRIYFGTLQPNKQVAIKVIYAMELSPTEIWSVSYEAQLLSELKHPNIVECLGICVMPPALALVCELCANGSLFSFLYKPANMKFFEHQDEKELKEKRTNMMSMFSGVDLMPLINSIASSVMGESKNTSMSRTSMGESFRMSASTQYTCNFPAQPEVWSQSHAEIESRRYSEGCLTDGPLMSAFPVSENDRDSQGSSMRSALGAITSRSSLGGSTARNSLGGSILSPVHETRQLTGGFDQGVDGPSSMKSSSSLKSSKSLENMRAKLNSSSKSGKVVKQNEVQMKTMQRRELPNTSESEASELGESDSVDTNQTAMSTISKSPSLGVQASLGLRLKMMVECASAISFMHEKGYVHCDLKSLNFLVADGFTIKLADLGDARAIAPPKKKDPPAKTVYQTLPSRLWAAPELLCPGTNVREAYEKGSDVYGLAIVLSELATCRLPHTEQWEACSPEMWYEEIQREDFRPDLSNNFGVPQSALNSIQAAWKTNPKERISASELQKAMEKAASSTPA